MTRLPAVEDAGQAVIGRSAAGAMPRCRHRPRPEDSRRREATMKLDVRLFVLIGGVIVILALLLAALD
jgi:hypothetical protein